MHFKGSALRIGILSESVGIVKGSRDPDGMHLSYSVTMGWLNPTGTGPGATGGAESLTSRPPGSSKYWDYALHRVRRRGPRAWAWCAHGRERPGGGLANPRARARSCARASVSPARWPGSAHPTLGDRARVRQ